MGQNLGISIKIWKFREVINLIIQIRSNKICGYKNRFLTKLLCVIAGRSSTGLVGWNAPEKQQGKSSIFFSYFRVCKHFACKFVESIVEQVCLNMATLNIKAHANRVNRSNRIQKRLLHCQGHNLFTYVCALTVPPVFLILRHFQNKDLAS